jgi:hypothetical protein
MLTWSSMGTGFSKYNTFYQETRHYHKPEVLRAHQFWVENFGYDPESDTFLCLGVSLYTSNPLHVIPPIMSMPPFDASTNVLTAPARLLKYRPQSRENLTVEEGERLRAARSKEVDTVFEHLEHTMSFPRFHLRVLDMVKTVWGM